MENLWPQKKITVSNQSPVIIDLLNQSSQELFEITQGKLRAEIESSGPNKNFFTYVFSIKAQGRLDGKFELLKVYSPNGDFPIVIDTPFLNKKSNKLYNINQMRSALKEIFSYDGTIKIINSMSYEAKVSNNYETPPYFIGPGRWKSPDGREYTTIILNGVTGHILIDQIKSLANPPSAKSSSYTEMPDGRYMLSIKISDELRMILEKKEVDWLRAQANVIFREMNEKNNS